MKRDAGLSMLVFSEDQAVDDYLSNLASELMILFDKPNTIFKATDVDPVEALGQAMEVLDGAEETLAGVETRANKHVAFLQVLMLFHTLTRDMTLLSAASCHLRLVHCVPSRRIVNGRTAVSTVRNECHDVHPAPFTALSMGHCTSHAALAYMARHLHGHQEMEDPLTTCQH